MAEALIGGLMTKGLQNAKAMHIFDTNSSRMELFSTRWPGIHTHATASEATMDADIVLLAVKPQVAQVFSARLPAATHFLLVKRAAHGIGTRCNQSNSPDQLNGCLYRGRYSTERTMPSAHYMQTMLNAV